MKKFGQKHWIWFLAGLCLVLLIATCVILIVTNKEPAAPAFVPPEFDSSAKQGTPEVPDDLGWSEVYKAGMSFKTSVCGEIRIQDGRAKVYLTNPAENTLWLKLRILGTNGVVLGETGLIRPGEYVSEISFGKLPQNGEKITLRIMSYQPETYYSGGTVNLSTVAQILD